MTGPGKYQTAAQRRIEYLQGRSCEDCGTTESLIVVRKEYSPGNPSTTNGIWQLAKAKLAAELPSCTVVCRGCQRKRMRERGTVPKLRHGSASMYRNGCRCPVCKTWRNEYARAWRAANPEKIAAYREAEKVRLLSRA